MARFFTAVVVAFAVCAIGAARADDEFSSVRQAPIFTAKWRDIQARMSEDDAHLSICRTEPETCSAEGIRLTAILAAARAYEGRARIGHINRALNLAIRPLNDLQRFGVPDRWSAPIETLRAGGGDCEDYAILKFLALRQAGFADSDLKLLIVRHPASRTDHAVLAARIEDEWLILDNLGFALVRLEDSRYRVLAQLAAEPSAAPAVSEIAGAPALPALL